jgi:site-specific recombinase XerD
MRHGRRLRVSKGIYRDKSGLAAVVSAAGQRQEHRFPLGTPLEEIREWREDTRLELLKTTPAAARGTLKADVERYLKQIQHLASWRERRAELKAWSARHGSLRRRQIKPAMVRETMGVWAQDGKSPKTITNRVNTLAHLYRTLDGKRRPTPCDEVTRPAAARTPPVTVSPAIVRKVEAQLRAHEACGWIRNAKTRARFMVLASTGRRKSELERAKPEDVDLERRVWLVRDGKGGWSPGIYLNDDMVAAWRVFLAANAWGAWNAGSMARVLRKAGWPAAVRPYNMRHAVGLALSEAGIDLSDVQVHMGHTRIATTRKFYVPVLTSRLEAAGKAIEGRIGWESEEPAIAQPGPEEPPVQAS